MYENLIRGGRVKLKGTLGKIFTIGNCDGRQKSPNNLINADHYHGGASKFIGFAKVQAVIKVIAVYPWQVIKTFGRAAHARTRS